MTFWKYNGETVVYICGKKMALGFEQISNDGCRKSVAIDAVDLTYRSSFRTDVEFGLWVYR